MPINPVPPASVEIAGSFLQTSARNLLQGTGGIAAAVAIVAAGGIIWRAIDQGVFRTGQGPAFTAWDEAAASPGDPRSLIRAAVLAVNNHNTQPWRFVARVSTIDLFADLSRNTGALDPTLRELHISLGAALENMATAAGPNGFTTEVTLFPDESDQTHIARVDLTPAPVTELPAFTAIPRRQTDRNAFDRDRVPTSEQLTALAALNKDDRIDLVWLTTEADRARFSDLTIQATEAINADDQQSIDSALWLRSDWGKLQSSKDGITLDTSGLTPIMRAGAKIIPVTSRAESDKSWLKMTKDPQLSTAPVFGIIVSRALPSREDCVSAGRLYQRMSLLATLDGLVLQPLNQIPERIDRATSLGESSSLEPAMAALIGRSGAGTLMPFRIGYAKGKGLKSPRRPAEEVTRLR